MKLIYTMIAIAIITISNISYAAPWVELDQETAKSTLSDVTFNGDRLRMYLAPDGSQKAKWGGQKYTGEFYISEEGHYCAQWQSEGFTDVGCWSVKMKKKKIKFSPESGRARKGFAGKIKLGDKL